MGCWTAAKMVPPNDPGKTTPLADADYIHIFLGVEDVHQNLIAHLRSAAVAGFTLCMLFLCLRCGFSRREQQLLLCALAGNSATDQELAGALGVSIPTIKKMWSSIYDRVADASPEIVPALSRPHRGKSERGKEKRRRLLVYLREHPEDGDPLRRFEMEQQRALERGERELVDPQRPLEWMPAQSFDELGCAEHDARLRAAEQLVAREADEVGAGRERVSRGRLVLTK